MYDMPSLNPLCVLEKIFRFLYIIYPYMLRFEAHAAQLVASLSAQQLYASILCSLCSLTGTSLTPHSAMMCDLVLTSRGTISHFVVSHIIIRTSMIPLFTVLNNAHYPA